VGCAEADRRGVRKLGVEGGAAWGRCGVKQLSEEWVSLVREGLVYYLLKSVGWVLEHVQAHCLIVHSYAMK